MQTRCLLGNSWSPAVLAALGTVLWLAAQTGQCDELPRYKLKVGQELVYRTTDPPKESDDGEGGKQSSHYVQEWTADVVERDAEGSLWVVFRKKITSTYARQGKENKQEYQSDGHFKLTADGKFVDNKTIATMTDPSPVFPTLPPTAASLQQGWEDSLASDDMHRKFHVASDAPLPKTGEWRFIAETQSALDPIYEQTTSRDFLFDLDAGLVRKVVNTFVAGWPKRDKGKPELQTIELAESRQLDESDAGQVAEQAKIYFAAVDEYERTVKASANDLAKTATYYNRAAEKLKALKGKLTVPWMETMLESRLKQHQTDMKYAVEDAVKFVKLLDKPSQDWKTTDLEGHPRALADYRGQVVLLDFWYRGCGWCIRAMPQMKQLAEDFAGQPVSVVGVNSDDNLDDARFVIERMKLNYPTIRNGEGNDRLNICYQINGWPTLVLIDKQGVVRHLHFGYSPTLRSELGDRIRALLAEPAS